MFITFWIQVFHRATVKHPTPRFQYNPTPEHAACVAAGITLAFSLQTYAGQSLANMRDLDLDVVYCLFVDDVFF